MVGLGLGLTRGVCWEYIWQVISPKVVCRMTLLGLSMAWFVPAPAEGLDAGALEVEVEEDGLASLLPPKSFLSLSILSLYFLSCRWLWLYW